MAPNAIAAQPGFTLAALQGVDLVAAGYLARYKGCTRAAYIVDLRAYYRWCSAAGVDPLAVTRAHLELYCRTMEEEQHLAPATVARRIGTVAGMLRFAVMDGHLERNPAEYVQRPVIDYAAQRRTVLHPLEYAAVLKAARTSGSLTDHAIIALLGMLGLRVGELCAADVTDLRTEHGYDVLHLVGKGNKAAVIPLPIPVMRPLRDAVGDRTTGPLLLNRDGRRLDRKAVDRIITRIAKVAGISHDVTPHGLRRSFATAGFTTGVPLREMQIAMRHADPKTTVRSYDMARSNLDRHAGHQVAAYLAGMTN